MRLMFKALVPALAGGLIATMAPAASAAPVVPDSLFGQHVSTLPGGVPGTLSSVGAIRLWDSGVSWRDLEPSRDGYNWAPLLAAVSNAKTLGASEIMYTMGVTPKWAASNPNSSKALYGPGSNSHPASTADYVDFIDDMLRAVPGITAVQIWNEANLQDFYQGTPAQMAELTKAAAPVIRARGAKVVAASTTMRKTGPTQKFGKSYGAAMKKARAWSSVDVLSVHLYPPAKEGPATRVAYIKKTKKLLQEVRRRQEAAVGHGDELRRPSQLHEGQAGLHRHCGADLRGSHLHRLDALRRAAGVLVRLGLQRRWARR